MLIAGSTNGSAGGIVVRRVLGKGTAMYRSVVLVSVVLAIAGCGGGGTPVVSSAASESAPSSSSPTGPVSSVAAGPTANESTLPPGLQGRIPEDIFTRLPDPLNLTITLDAGAAVANVIDSKGGEVSANGADGATYQLIVPPGAVALSTEIKMSPIASVVGIPEEAGARTTFGVLFEPNGLQLAKPATLRITFPQPVGNETAAVLEFQGSGAEAGFHDFERTDSGITTEIDHFSGLTWSSPFEIDAIPPTLRMKFYSQSEAEARLTSEIASILALIRQQEQMGAEPIMTAAELAASALGAFKRLVISPRVAVADKSCWNAMHAMEAYLDYQRQRQKLGVGDDPAFDLVGAGFYVPAALVDLAVSVCFKEAYDRCVKSGDFPSLAAYYLTFFERAHLLAGADSHEHISTASDYLQRCGRWRVKLATTIDDQDVGIAPYHNEATREFHVQWQPGTGAYGLEGSTITGSGQVDQTQITHTGSCNPATITNIRSGVDSSAEIKLMAFDHYEGPTQTGDPIPPVPIALSLDINLGVGVHDYWCNKPDGADYKDIEEESIAVYVVQGLAEGKELTVQDLFDMDAGKYHMEISKDWRYDLSPYRAATVIEGRYEIGSGPGGHAYQDGRLEIIVEHEPL